VSARPLPLAAVYIYPTRTVGSEEENHLDALETLRRNLGCRKGPAYVEMRGRAACRRPKLRRLLATARRRAFDVLLVTSLDDLADTRLGVLRVVLQLAESGVCVKSADGQQLDPQCPGVRWLAGEHERHRGRVAAGLAAKREMGERIGNLPLGYAVDEDGQTLVPDPREQALIRESRRLAGAGCSTREIARLLTAAGYTSRTGTAVTHRTVGRLLKVWPPMPAGRPPGHA
jgi:DNA invertase Pin-like site-specific DNA recombinase